MTTQSKRTVAFALCGSFCSFAAVLPQLRVLTARGWDVLPVLSASAAGLDTRQQRAQARECVFRQVRKPLGLCHVCLSVGVVSPRYSVRLQNAGGSVQSA